MKDLIILIIAIVLFESCSKAGDSEFKDITLLLGKWEADYSVTKNDTAFYNAVSSTPCAYAILPFDYNSGFEFNSGFEGELIWCGTNKGQFFDWEFKKPNLKLSYKNQTSTLEVSNLSEKSMDVRVDENNTLYHLVKTN